MAEEVHELRERNAQMAQEMHQLKAMLRDLQARTATAEQRAAAVESRLTHGADDPPLLNLARQQAQLISLSSRFRQQLGALKTARELDRFSSHSSSGAGTEGDHILGSMNNSRAGTEGGHTHDTASSGGLHPATVSTSTRTRSSTASSNNHAAAAIPSSSKQAVRHPGEMGLESPPESESPSQPVLSGAGTSVAGSVAGSRTHKPMPQWSGNLLHCVSRPPSEGVSSQVVSKVESKSIRASHSQGVVQGFREQGDEDDRGVAVSGRDQQGDDGVSVSEGKTAGSQQQRRGTAATAGQRSEGSGRSGGSKPGAGQQRMRSVHAGNPLQALIDDAEMAVDQYHPKHQASEISRTVTDSMSSQNKQGIPAPQLASIQKPNMAPTTAPTQPVVRTASSVCSAANTHTSPSPVHHAATAATSDATTASGAAPFTYSAGSRQPALSHTWQSSAPAASAFSQGAALPARSHSASSGSVSARPSEVVQLPARQDESACYSSGEYSTSTSGYSRPPTAVNSLDVDGLAFSCLAPAGSLSHVSPGGEMDAWRAATPGAAATYAATVQDRGYSAVRAGVPRGASSAPTQIQQGVVMGGRGDEGGSGTGGGADSMSSARPRSRELPSEEYEDKYDVSGLTGLGMDGGWSDRDEVSSGWRGEPSTGVMLPIPPVMWPRVVAVDDTTATSTRLGLGMGGEMQDEAVPLQVIPSEVSWDSGSCEGAEEGGGDSGDGQGMSARRGADGEVDGWTERHVRQEASGRRVISVMAITSNSAGVTGGGLGSSHGTGGGMEAQSGCGVGRHRTDSNGSSISLSGHSARREATGMGELVMSASVSATAGTSLPVPNASLDGPPSPFGSMRTPSNTGSTSRTGDSSTTTDSSSTMSSSGSSSIASNNLRLGAGNARGGMAGLMLTPNEVFVPDDGGQTPICSRVHGGVMGAGAGVGLMFLGDSPAFSDDSEFSLTASMAGQAVALLGGGSVSRLTRPMSATRSVTRPAASPLGWQGMAAQLGSRAGQVAPVQQLAKVLDDVVNEPVPLNTAGCAMQSSTGSGHVCPAAARASLQSLPVPTGDVPAVDGTGRKVAVSVGDGLPPSVHHPPTAVLHKPADSETPVHPGNPSHPIGLPLPPGSCLQSTGPAFHRPDVCATPQTPANTRITATALGTEDLASCAAVPAPPTAQAGPTVLRRRLSHLRDQMAMQQEASTTTDAMLSQELSWRLQVEASQRQQVTSLQQQVQALQLQVQHLTEANEALMTQNGARSQRIAQLEGFMARIDYQLRSLGSSGPGAHTSARQSVAASCMSMLRASGQGSIWAEPYFAGGAAGLTAGPQHGAALSLPGAESGAAAGEHANIAALDLALATGPGGGGGGQVTSGEEAKIAHVVRMIRQEVQGRRTYTQKLEAALQAAQARIISLQALEPAQATGIAALLSEASCGGEPRDPYEGPEDGGDSPRGEQEGPDGLPRLLHGGAGGSHNVQVLLQQIEARDQLLQAQQQQLAEMDFEMQEMEAHMQWLERTAEDSEQQLDVLRAVSAQQLSQQQTHCRELEARHVHALGRIADLEMQLGVGSCLHRSRQDFVPHAHGHHDVQEHTGKCGTGQSWDDGPVWDRTVMQVGGLGDSGEFGLGGSVSKVGLTQQRESGEQCQTGWPSIGPDGSRVPGGGGDGRVRDSMTAGDVYAPQPGARMTSDRLYFGAPRASRVARSSLDRDSSRVRPGREAVGQASKGTWAHRFLHPQQFGVRVKGHGVAGVRVHTTVSVSRAGMSVQHAHMMSQDEQDGHQ